jgi:AGCS family alanine or glycine:cation symporter
MGGLYVLSAALILIANFEAVPNVIKIIFLDAFSGTSVAGGTLIGVIMYGIQRGAFSNEAGIGTEALIHGTAKTNNPIKQGFVAMIGPVFDTLLICTATAVVIILSGLWASDEYSGVSLTAMAFQAFLGNVGIGIVFLCVVFFGISTIFTYSYYGSVCARFLFGVKGQKIYLYIFISTIVFFASISLDSAINIIDGSFAMMAIPTLVSSIILAPKVVAEASKFLAR